MTWQVEQAHEPPHAPVKNDVLAGMPQYACFSVPSLSDGFGCTAVPLTFHLQIIGLGNVQQVISLGDLKIMSISVFVDERDM